MTAVTQHLAVTKHDFRYSSTSEGFYPRSIPTATEFLIKNSVKTYKVER